MRLLPIDSHTLKLQRMAVPVSHRKKASDEFFDPRAEDFARKQGFQKITLGAQLTAKGFIFLGYQPEGEEFLDADMPHIKMSKYLQN